MFDKLKSTHMKLIIMIMIIFFTWGFFKVANAQNLPYEIIGFNENELTNVFSNFGNLSLNSYTLPLAGKIKYLESYMKYGRSFGVLEPEPTDLFRLNYLNQNASPSTCFTEYKTAEELGLIFYDNISPDNEKKVLWKFVDSNDCVIDPALGRNIVIQYSPLKSGLALVNFGNSDGFLWWYAYNDKLTQSTVDPLFSDTTRFLGNFNPALNFYDPSDPANINFSFNWFSGFPIASQVGIEIQNLSFGFSLPEQIEQVSESGTLNFSTTTQLFDGVYQWRGVIRGDNFEVFSPYRLFTIGTTSNQSIVPEPIDCNLGSWISDSLCNILAFLFIPSPQRLQSFQDLYIPLSQVKPFGYVIQVFQLRSGMEISDPNVQFTNLPLKNEIFNPIRSGLIVILWAMFLFYLYNRFKRIDI